MYIRRDIEPRVIWFFSWKPLLLYLIISTVAYTLYIHGKVAALAIPFLPVATIGTAVAFYVGFKNNASYERLWEARKIWAELEHISRFFAMIVAKEHSIDSKKQSLIYRQLAWLNCVRIQLRQRATFHDVSMEELSHVKIAAERRKEADATEEMRAMLVQFVDDDEMNLVLAKRNVATQLLFQQAVALDSLKDVLKAEDYAKIIDTINSCSQQQAAAERINSFPFPRQYAYMSTLFVNIFIVLLPFSLIGELFKNDPKLAWLTIPFSMLISWVFYTMEKVGDTSENPFENGINDVPMAAICREVEIDLRTMLNEKEIPSPLEAVDSILL